jgi:hypothetical protein
MNVYQRLSLAREKFHALKLTKTGHNKFAGYYYFELGDFLIPALRVFREVGLCAHVTFDKDEAMLIIRCDDKPEDWFSIQSPMGSAALKGCHEVQNIGAVETYQRRYLWVAALEIVEHDALDATTGKAEKPPTDDRCKPTEEIFKMLQPEVQDFLRRAAPRIASAMPDVAEVRNRIGIILDNYPEDEQNDVRAGLESLLDSKVRSAIKRAEKETA